MIKKRESTSSRAPHGNRRVWAPQEVALLGRIPDAAVAALLGLARRTVLMERKRRGIAPAHPEKRPKKHTTETPRHRGERAR